MGFRNMLRAGQVAARKGSIARFTETGVVLDDGSELHADLVVFGTGFTKSYAYLEPEMVQRLNRQSDGLYLYRNIFPQGLQAIWLRKVLTGKVVLPSPKDMEAHIAVEQGWKRSWMPAKGDRAAILQLHKMKYHDQLCGDMGASRMRKGWNLLAEAFAPYSAADYARLFQVEKELETIPCNTPTLLRTLGQDTAKGTKNDEDGEAN